MAKKNKKKGLSTKVKIVPKEYVERLAIRKKKAALRREQTARKIEKEKEEKQIRDLDVLRKELELQSTKRLLQIRY
ncbi:MAG: hypothetical protein J7K75_13525 [Desulfuromonas sp.]|nr:hypothetical protein [Desulfuromonas sp.]